jgi:hypothetical protein
MGQSLDFRTECDILAKDIMLALSFLGMPPPTTAERTNAACDAIARRIHEFRFRPTHHNTVTGQKVQILNLAKEQAENTLVYQDEHGVVSVVSRDVFHRIHRFTPKPRT